MTSFEIQVLPFDRDNLAVWSQQDERRSNWPVVYMLHDRTKIYVGETLNADSRLKQHLDAEERRLLDEALVIIDESYNKSVQGNEAPQRPHQTFLGTRAGRNSWHR